MAEQLSNRIGLEMAGVRNTDDARHVSDELHQAVYGMSLNDSLAFVRQVRSARISADPNPAHGEFISTSTDMTSAHVYLSFDGKPLETFELRDGKAQITPERVATDMENVRSTTDATAAFQELSTAVDGMDVAHTADFVSRTNNLIARWSQNNGQPQKPGADVALVTGAHGEQQLVFTSPYAAPVRAALTDDSQTSKP